MEDLPRAPEWKMVEVAIDGYKTAKPIVFFYRDPLECAQALLQNPIFEGRWDFTPRHVYDDPERKNRIYGEWMTGDGAWEAQVCFCPCALIGTVFIQLILVLIVHPPSRWNSPWHHPLLRQNKYISRNG
jgi:hypothetical protein